MIFYQNITEFLTEKIEEKNTIDDIENFIQQKYNIHETFIANNLFYGQQIEFCGTSKTIHTDDKIFIHNPKTICLLFPDYSARIACTKAFIDNLPYYKQILTGVWKDDNIFQNEYYCEYEKKNIKSSINIICHDVDMQSILYDNPLKLQIRTFEAKNYFTIKNIECTNLLDSIIIVNKGMYDTHNFMSYEN